MSLCIYIGTENPAKVKAVQTVVDKYKAKIIDHFGLPPETKITCYPYNVESGVPSNPENFSQTIKGARNRAINALSHEVSTNCSLAIGVGIESGFIGFEPELPAIFNFDVCAITQSDGSSFFGFSQGIEYPFDPVLRVLKGGDFNQEMEKHLGLDEIDREKGVIGELTDNHYPRYRVSEIAVEHALFRLLHNNDYYRSEDLQQNKPIKTIVIATHILGGNLDSEDTYSLQARFHCLKRIIENSDLSTSNYKIQILILKQPGTEKDLHLISFREKQAMKWQNIAATLPDLILIYDNYYVLGEPTTLAWNKLQLHAFSRLNADMFVYVDPGIARWDSVDRERVEKNLGLFVKQSLNYDYVIGNYTPILPGSKFPKTTDDDIYKKILIEECVQQLFDEKASGLLGGLGITRPRSEFHALSKNFYDNLIKAPVKCPYDYGLQMLQVACKKQMAIKAIDLGEIPEIGKYTTEKVLAQIDRVKFQLSQLKL